MKLILKKNNVFLKIFVEDISSYGKNVTLRITCVYCSRNNSSNVILSHDKLKEV